MLVLCDGGLWSLSLAGKTVTASKYYQQTFKTQHPDQEGWQKEPIFANTKLLITYSVMWLELRGLLWAVTQLWPSWFKTPLWKAVLDEMHFFQDCKVLVKFVLWVHITFAIWRPHQFLSLWFCASGVMKEELNSVNIKESLSKLTDHSSSKLASQASSILTTLSDAS